MNWKEGFHGPKCLKSHRHAASSDEGGLLTRASRLRLEEAWFPLVDVPSGLACAPWPSGRPVAHDQGPAVLEGRCRQVWRIPNHVTLVRVVTQEAGSLPFGLDPPLTLLPWHVASHVADPLGG